MLKQKDGIVILKDFASKELITCKNCVFCIDASFGIDGNNVGKHEYCSEYASWTNPEGYCWKAVRKDVLDGR